VPTRRHRRRLRCLLLALAIAGVSVSACFSTDPASRPAAPGEPKVAAIPVMTGSSGRLPLQDYSLSAGQIQQTDRARLVLIDHCMRRFGFRYHRELPKPPHGSTDLGRRYGLTDLALAARNGYRLTAPKAPKRPELSAVEDAVLLGGGAPAVGAVTVPRGGCLDEANRRLDAKAPPGADIQLGQRMMFDSFTRSQQDSRVKQAFTTWNRCMAESGYHYPSPLAPFGDRTLQQDAKRGVQVATADVRCKQRSNVVGIWFTVESAYQQRMIEQNGTALRRTRQAIDARLRTAAAVRPAPS
jgi:hypothetical protein